MNAGILLAHIIAAARVRRQSLQIHKKFRQFFIRAYQGSRQENAGRKDRIGHRVLAVRKDSQAIGRSFNPHLVWEGFDLGLSSNVVLEVTELLENANKSDPM
jgi:hypothetical protein